MRSTPWLIVLLLAGCHGGLHRRGEWQVIGDVSYGTPAGDALVDSGGADAPNVGVRLTGASFVKDRTAVALAGSYRSYDPDSGGVDAVEAQVGARYYPPIDFHLGKVPLAPYVDAFGGLLHASEDFPVGGTATNLTAEVGLGIEAMVGKSTSVLAGYRYRHLSNGEGNEPDNPAYNDHQFYIGLGWRW